MAVDTQSQDASREPDRPRKPEITVCESRPGTVVLIETGTTDGWIASDLTTGCER